MGMPVRRWIPYRANLTRRAQALRRDPTPAEKKLWFEFLRDLPEKFTRQKPLGRYVADFYCSSHRLVIELDGDSHFTDAAERYDERRTVALAHAGIRVLRFTNIDVLANFEAVCVTINTALTEKS
jgi:very-short-patch-repair endonuclease